eukprot:scaffold12986_cov68-Cyclotella_meneghiniana.AAC.3
MMIDATLIGAEVSPLTADGGMNKAQPSIRIGTSNTSFESFSQWLGILWSCDGDKTAFKRLSFELILLDDLLYKIAQQDTHHQLVQRGEESNHFKIAAPTRQRLKKGNANVFGGQNSPAIQCIVSWVD